MTATTSVTVTTAAIKSLKLATTTPVLPLNMAGTITVTGNYSTIPESHGGKKYRGAAIGGTMGYSYSAQVVEVSVDEETGVSNGVTILVNGTRVTKGGAAFAGAEMAFAGGKWDTFRMLTHPGTSIIPGALVAAEVTGASGREFITGLAAGYEVIVPDLRGHGESDVDPEDRYDIVTYSRDVEALVRGVLGHERCGVVAGSPSTIEPPLTAAVTASTPMVALEVEHTRSPAAMSSSRAHSSTV